MGGVTGTHGMRKGHDSSRGAPENEAEDHSEPQWMQGARRALWGQQDPRTPEWEAETGVHGLTGVVLEVPGCTKCTVARGVMLVRVVYQLRGMAGVCGVGETTPGCT